MALRVQGLREPDVFVRRGVGVFGAGEEREATADYGRGGGSGSGRGAGGGGGRLGLRLDLYIWLHLWLHLSLGPGVGSRTWGGHGRVDFGFVIAVVVAVAGVGGATAWMAAAVRE